MRKDSVASCRLFTTLLTEPVVQAIDDIKVYAVGRACSKDNLSSTPVTEFSRPFPDGEKGQYGRLLTVFKADHVFWQKECNGKPQLFLQCEDGEMDAHAGF